MKRTIAMLAFSICAILAFQSCDDEVPLEEKETLIKYRIICDTPDAQMLIYANGLDDAGFYKKGIFEKELYTKSYFAYVEVRCKDPKVAIHIDLYVNNKLKASTDGNTYVVLSRRIKGKDPYSE